MGRMLLTATLLVGFLGLLLGETNAQTCGSSSCSCNSAHGGGRCAAHSHCDGARCSCNSGYHESSQTCISSSSSSRRRSYSSYSPPPPPPTSRRRSTSAAAARRAGQAAGEVGGSVAAEQTRATHAASSGYDSLMGGGGGTVLLILCVCRLLASCGGDDKKKKTAPASSSASIYTSAPRTTPRPIPSPAPAPFPMSSTQSNPLASMQLSSMATTTNSTYMPPTLSSSGNGGMGTCTFCGSAKSPSTRFCTSCGGDGSTSTSSAHGGGMLAGPVGATSSACTGCGAAKDPAVAFCTSCGMRTTIPDVAMPSPIDDGATTPAIIATAVDIESAAKSQMPKDLAGVLAAAKLSHFEAALRAFGCALPADLMDVEDSDFAEIGMKKIEVKRMRREVEQLGLENFSF